LKCGTITDLDDKTVKEITRKVAAALRFKPTGQRMDVYGICENCSKVAKPE
jgi:Fe2+ or Zn2+ uptake regulation protein